MDFFTAYFLNTICSGILESLGEQGFRKTVELLFGRREEAPAEREVQKGVRTACLLATESACAARLVILGSAPELSWRIRFLAPVEESEAVWLREARQALRQERKALRRDEHEPFPCLSTEELAFLVEQGGGEVTKPVRQLREALAARALEDLQREHGPAPDAFRSMLRDGWTVEEAGDPPELRSWFGHVCAFFRRELQRNESLRDALQTQILAKLVTNGIALTLPQLEAHLASSSGQLSERLDEMEKALSLELRENTGEIKDHVDMRIEGLLPRIGLLPNMAAQLQVIFDEVNALRDQEHEAGDVGGLPDRDVLLAYLEWLQAKHRELKIPGIPGVAASPVVELERVYVALKGDYASPIEQQSASELLDLEWSELDLAAVADGSEPDLYAQRAKLIADRALPRQKVREADRQTLTLGEAFRREPRLVILGGPGSGKTTLVRWLTLKLAEALGEGSGEVRVPAFQVDPEAGRDESPSASAPPGCPSSCGSTSSPASCWPARPPLTVSWAGSPGRRSAPSSRATSPSRSCRALPFLPIASTGSCRPICAREGRW